MSAALRLKVGLCAAGLSYLLVGYAQAQQQVKEQIKPAQYADEDSGRPLRERREMGRRDYEGQRTTTHFRGPGEAGSNASGATASASVDHYLANCLSIKNQAEIDLNEFAVQHAKSNDVKEFARQMIQDHRQLGEKLDRLTRDNSSSPDASLAELLKIDRQITDRCGQMARTKLEESPDFDKCFVGAQVGGHMQMLAALEVISQQAGGDLRQITQDAQPTVEKHLKHAEDLMKQLDAESGKQSERQARN